MNIFSYFRPKTLAHFKSKINDNIDILKKNGKKIIYVAGAEQTGGTITGMWKRALSLIQYRWENMQNALVLGLGGGDVIRLVHKLNPRLVITAVDIDPVMIKIARDYFDLTDSFYLKIYQRDAYYFLLLNRKKYDFIVVDLFVGFKNPQKARSTKFLKLLRGSLAGGGLIVYNSHYHSDLNSEFEDFHHLCTKIFTEVEILISYPYSKILLLSN